MQDRLYCYSVSELNCNTLSKHINIGVIVYHILIYIACHDKFRGRSRHFLVKGHAY